MEHPSKNTKLMDSLTINQLEICEKSCLIDYIKTMREVLDSLSESTTSLWPKETPATTTTSSVGQAQFQDFIDETFDEAPCNQLKNDLWLAPTSFGDIHMEYKQWCMGLGIPRYQQYTKQQLKEELIEWQKQSIFGLFIGGSMKEARPNGSHRVPYFNLVVKPEV